MDNARQLPQTPGFKWGRVTSLPVRLSNALKAMLLMILVGVVTLVGVSVLFHGAPPTLPSAQVRLLDLPTTLSPDDAERYAQAFALQAVGANAGADKVLERVEDRLILSHVLSDRFLRQRRPNYGELTEWLRR